MRSKDVVVGNTYGLSYDKTARVEAIDPIGGMGQWMVRPVSSRFRSCIIVHASELVPLEIENQLHEQG